MERPARPGQSNSFNVHHHTPHRHSKIIASLTAWRKRCFSDSFFAPVLAVVIGLITGGCAFLLKKMIAAVSTLLQAGASATSVNWRYIILPIAGILLTGIFVRYVVKIDITHGIDKVLAKIRQKIYNIKSRVMVAPMLASTITLGFGGSAGSEGPIATTGAAIGSNFARWFGLPPKLMMIMIGCGAGAGIAGIFKSPLGGFLFTLEVLRLEMTTVSVITLLVSTITAATTAYILSGCTPDLLFLGEHTFDPATTPVYICLGIFCGVYSLYYSRVMKTMQRKYNSIANPWIKNLSGGTVLGVCLILFPSLYGEGYSVIAKLLADDYSAIVDNSPWYTANPTVLSLILISAGILLLKCFAASASNSAGGVAGDFAPTLFAGSIAGLLFALVANTFIPGVHIPASDCIFVAMGGVMAGAIRAPLMALFLTVEMTGCYTLFLPALIVCAISFGIVRLITHRNYFESHF